jgi:hypothetical protein
MDQGKILTSQDIVGAEVLNTYADPGGKGDWLEVCTRGEETFWIWEDNINYADSLIGQKLEGLT